MIQHTGIRTPSSALGPVRQTQLEGPHEWGKWVNQKHYSLEIVQHPSRARMCGFGDKDRRPLAPAAVAKMIVRREDNSLVDIDEVDISFFLVTVDLWSHDGTKENNLVLHPSSTDRYIPSTIPGKQRKREKSNAASTSRPAQTPGSTSGSSQPRPGEPSTPIITPSNPGYPFPPPAPPSFSEISYPSTWGYNSQQHADRNTTFQSTVLPSIHTFGRTSSSGSEAQGDNTWHQENANDVYRQWHPDSNYSGSESYNANSENPSSRTSPQRPEGWNHAGGFSSPTAQSSQPSSPNQIIESSSSIYATPSSSYPQQPPFYQQPNLAQTAPPPSSMPLPPRNLFTRTLVGPLSANATRLLDEHRKPGIFFLFQDLSVRTEGTFRLRLRLMNVGAHPAPEMGATHVHTDVSPVLAQSFTQPFTVFSAKRFPGVPDTTALSVAFGSQGQKLPLRNRHGSGKRRRQGDSDSDDESDGD